MRERGKGVKDTGEQGSEGMVRGIWERVRQVNKGRNEGKKWRRIGKINEGNR